MTEPRSDEPTSSASGGAREPYARDAFERNNIERSGTRGLFFGALVVLGLVGLFAVASFTSTLTSRVVRDIAPEVPSGLDRWQVPAGPTGHVGGATFAPTTPAQGSGLPTLKEPGSWKDVPVLGGKISVDPNAVAPTAYSRTFTVGSLATVPLLYATGSTHAFAICVNQTTGVGVYVVSPAAANTTGGTGPYCDTCAGGAAFPIGTASARTAAGSATVGCTFYNSPLASAIGVGGGGGGGGGGGDTIEVNAVATGDTNFNGTTPVAPAGGYNVVWQVSGAAPTDASAYVDTSDLLDILSATRGSVLYRGAAGWAALGPGAAGEVLSTNGAGADPTWAAGSAGAYLPLDAASVGQTLTNYAIDDGLYINDGSGSSTQGYLDPLYLQWNNDDPTTSSSASWYSVPPGGGAIVSEASLYAHGATAAGSAGGHVLAGSPELRANAADASTWGHLDLQRGAGWSFSQGATEWLALGATGASFNTGGSASLDFTVASDTDSDMIFCDSSANTCLLGSTTATSTGALSIQPTTSNFGLISQRAVDGPFRNYIANTNSGTLAYSSMEWLSDGVGNSAITRYSSTYPGTLAGLPNATALDIYTNADMRIRADGGDVAFIALTTPLAYLGAAGWMAGVAGTPDIGSVSLPWDDLFIDGLIYDPTGGTIDLGGALTMSQRRVTATPTTVALTDGAIICDTGSNSITLNLPGTHAEGQTLVVVKASASNTCTLDPSGVELIDGGSTYALNALGSAVSITFNVAYGGWFVTSARNGEGASGGFLPLNANSVAQSLTNYPSLTIDGPIRANHASLPQFRGGTGFDDEGLGIAVGEVALYVNGGPIAVAGATSFVPGTDGTIDLGNASFAWDDMSIDGIISNPNGSTISFDDNVISATSEAVSLGDASHDWAELWVNTIRNGDGTTVAFDDGITTTLGANFSSNKTTPDVVQLPRAVAASGVTLPACSTITEAGSMIYVDDTDDAASGELCVCRANSAGTYAWVAVADNATACIDP